MEMGMGGNEGKGEKSTTIAHRRLPVATRQSHGLEEARRRVFVIHGGQAQARRNGRMGVTDSGKAQIRTSGFRLEQWMAEA